MPSSHTPLQLRARLFAALGDETRLLVLVRLARGEPQSIARLTAATDLTRQAVTKHLRVLEHAGVVRCRSEGREKRYELDTASINDARKYLKKLSHQWKDAIERLQAFVEK